MANVVGIRFKRAGRFYYFDPVDIELAVSDYVVVKTSRGLELGQVVIAPEQVMDSELEEPLKPVVRRAEAEDIEQAQELETKGAEALVECGKWVDKLKLPMKLLSAEYNLGGSRLTVFFSAAERVDFRELVKELANHFKVRVELRQVGPRDGAKLVGGFGRCGRPLCCVSFLDEFAPVSIKMAKDQDLPLNPMKISGVCGRLMCCLGYEAEVYRAMREKLPRRGQQVSTSKGMASVAAVNPLKETVTVELESGASVELPLSEIAVEASQPRRRRKRG
ncbi:MAG: stage 0 sporulation family protein [Dehalococcoidales bacterium]|nr:stage 0 sporulation family protein [Dehalococcoidales bacterium]